MGCADNGKPKTAKDRRNRTTKNRKSQNAWRKGNLQVREIDTIKQAGMKEKNLK